MLTHRYGRVWPKITDFGSLARLAHTGASVIASRHSALDVPPEGWDTPNSYDSRLDLYQTGFVLFEMVHGPLPYDGPTYLDRDGHRELQALATTSGGVIGAFERQQVVKQAIAWAARGRGVTRFAGARYQSLSEMIGDLETLRLPN